MNARRRGGGDEEQLLQDPSPPARAPPTFTQALNKQVSIQNATNEQKEERSIINN